VKVLQVVGFNSVANGAAKVAFNIVNELKKMGSEGMVLNSSNCSNKVINEDQLFGMFYKPYSKMSKYKALIPSKGWGFPLEFNYPDIVHFHGVFHPIHVKLAQRCQEKQIPYILSPHGNLMREALKTSRFKKTLGLLWLFNNYIANASVIHALGEQEANDIKLLVPDANIKIVPNGILVDRDKTRCIKEGRLSDGNFEFLFLGRIDVKHKGIDILLDAVSAVANQLRNYDARVILAGPFTSFKNEKYVLQRISLNKLEDIVKILGPKYGEEKDKVLNSCDVFIHTSRYEGMPLAILEAMACGKPCLVTPGTNLANEVQRNDAGWVTDAKAENIADSLINILKLSSYQIRQKGKKAIKMVETKYSIANFNKGILGIYRNLI